MSNLSLVITNDKEDLHSKHFLIVKFIFSSKNVNDLLKYSAIKKMTGFLWYISGVRQIGIKIKYL